MGKWGKWQSSHFLPFALCPLPFALSIRKNGSLFLDAPLRFTMSLRQSPEPAAASDSGVGRSALELIKREVIADSHLWTKPEKTLYGVKNDDFANGTL